MNFLNLFGSREIDDWRDRHILTAAKTLNQLAADLIRDIDPLLPSATWRDGFLSPQSFIAGKVAPRVRVASEPVIEMIVAGANERLGEIARYQAIWTRRPDAPPIASSGFEGASEVALAAGPIAAGTAIAVALPTMAITTTGGLLGTGLLAATIVSWPVVAVGGAAVGVALATGALNAGRIWTGAETRLRRKVADHITMTLIRGTAEHPSALEQIAALFTDAASAARTLR